ncbi:MAG: hypothetical protein J6A79_04985, partial [Clostridia bacterium]|nr:hypothetical protein [Clostridia bacterium]
MKKAQKSSGFWANRTYRLCIKDNVLIDASCGCGAFLVRTVQSLGKQCKEHSDAKSSWIDQDNFCGIELDPQAA